MKSELTIILYWNCIWLWQDASAFNLPNSTNLNRRTKNSDMEYTDIDEDVDVDDVEDIENAAIDYSGFLVRVRVGNDEYTGTLIDPKIAIADPKTKTDTTQVCNYEGKECKAPEEITMIDNIAVLKLPTYILEPVIVERDIHEANCKAIGLGHPQPVDVKVTNVNIDCPNCKNYDAVICGNRLGGIVIGQPHFKLVGPRELLIKIGVPVDQDQDEDQDHEDDTVDEVAPQANDNDDPPEENKKSVVRKSSGVLRHIPDSIHIILTTTYLIGTTYLN